MRSQNIFEATPINMTAFDAMNEILDINELIESIKAKNVDTVPDLVSCRSVDKLSNYRELLVDIMQNITLAQVVKEKKDLPE